MNKVLIVIPTYNEKKNVNLIVKKIFLYLKNFEILFIDDNSPDGTKEIIKYLRNKKKNIYLIVRKRKMGIGSAHKLGIKWGYNKGFKKIVTMDCDGTHNPLYIKKMLKKLNYSDLVITNRFIGKKSLVGWPFYRKFLTILRHFIVRLTLKMPFDSSGALRCYDMKNIKLNDILLAKDNGYSFFWESIFILNKKNYKILEIPIKMPNRIEGNTKMKLSDIFYALYYLMVVFFKNK